MTRVRFALALLVAGSVAGAQDLGQAAARAREKREKKDAAGKAAPRVYTNEDLPKPEEQSESTGSAAAAEAVRPRRVLSEEDSPSRPVVQGDDAPVVESGTARGAETEGEDQTEEQGWRIQAAAARQPIQDAERKIVEIDERASAIRLQMSPFNPNRENDTNKLLALQEELRNIEAERETARLGLEEAKKSWEEFAETARRSGVPARWLEDAPR